MKPRWASLHGHSFFSILDGLGRPKDIAARAAELEIPAVALTDHGVVGGAVSFWQEMKKKGIRPILGVEAYICRDDASIRTVANGRPYNHLVVLAKNRDGWRELLKAVSRSNSKDHFYYQPRLHLEAFRDHARGGNLIAISGHPGSDMATALFLSPQHAKLAYSADDIEVVRERCIGNQGDARRRLLAKAEEYISVFGKDNFRLEVQVLNPDRMPASLCIANAMRWVGKKLGIPRVATADSHYVRQEDARDQRILLCSRLRTTLSQVQRKIDEGDDVELGGFFRDNCFHLPSPQEMAVHHLPDELAETLRVADMIEEYDITSPPRLPHFRCPDGHDDNTYLRELCRRGWGRLIEGQDLPKPLEVYRERLDYEFSVIKEAGLSPYFLIVADLMEFARGEGALVGKGRGSAAGCLVSYLTGITGIDPLRYDLLFERFYNAGRNTKERVSLPDIDCDFPLWIADRIFRYLSDKYGKDRVAKIATFQTMQGRSALDEVLAAHGLDFEMRKQVTKVIPDRARISEELQAMAEADPDREPSTIRYALETFPDELSEWATLRDDGTLEGDYAAYFAQAMRLEGTKKAISTHAAGIVIADRPLEELCPLRWDDGAGCYVAAAEYPALEAMGMLKLDALRIAMLDKGQAIQDILRYGKIRRLA